MRRDDSQQHNLPQNMTDAILSVYDSGTTKPVAIAAKLMMEYPMLSLATITSVVNTFRAPAKEKKAEKERPKRQSEILSEYLLKRCRACPYYSGLNVCVFPEQMCAFPDQKSEGERLRQLMAEENAEMRRAMAEKKKADKNHKEKAQEKAHRQKEKKKDAFAELEAEIDDMADETGLEKPVETVVPDDLEEELLLGFKPMDRYFVITDYIPPKNDEIAEEIFLEDFKDILKY